MLTDREINFLRLLHRSPDVGEGWRKVSATVWPLVENFGQKDLVEVEKFDVGGRVRLSERGTAVVSYLI